jgi:uncharacterized protein
MSSAFVVDMHGHVGDFGNFQMPDVSIDRLKRVYERCRIRCCIVSHVVALYSHSFQQGNKLNFEIVRKYPGFLYGYAVYDPHYPRESIADVKTYVDTDGFCGVKIYPSGHAYPLDGEGYRPLWELATEHDFPVLTHTWDPNPKRTVPYDWDSLFAQPKLMAAVAERFPHVKVIMAHTGGHYEGNIQAAKVAAKYANLWVDVCGEPIDYGFIEWVAGNIDVNRVLFGSDQNWIEPRAMLGRVLAADISNEDKAGILFRNAERLFGRRLQS